MVCIYRPIISLVAVQNQERYRLGDEGLPAPSGSGRGVRWAAGVVSFLGRKHREHIHTSTRPFGSWIRWKDLQMQGLGYHHGLRCLRADQWPFALSRVPWKDQLAIGKSWQKINFGSWNDRINSRKMDYIPSGSQFFGKMTSLHRQWRYCTQKFTLTGWWIEDLSVAWDSWKKSEENQNCIFTPRLYIL